MFQIAGSLCVFIGYWLNSKNHPRQHQLFILGHVFLIAFSIIESAWVLASLSVFVIYMQYKISKRKYKFKKDMVRIKKVAKAVKPEEIRIRIERSKLKRNDEYRDWETDRKSTRLNSSHLKLSRMQSSA